MSHWIICDWNLNKSAPLPHKFWETLKISSGWASECQSNQTAKHFFDPHLVIPHDLFVNTTMEIPLPF